MSVQGLAYVRAYYSGVVKLRHDTPLRYEIGPDRCPSFGEAGALILDPNDAGKLKKTSRLTLFCPFTLTANQITSEAGEICVVKKVLKKRKIEGVKEEDAMSDEVKLVERVPEQDLDDERVERLARIITHNWNSRCNLGLQSDLDVAAVVLQRMGKPVPEARLIVRKDATGQAKKTGRDAAVALLKAVNPSSKPGRVLAFFLPGGRSIIEAMAEFGSTRSSVQTSFRNLQEDNGIGYEQAADMVTIILPPDCQDPFAEPIVKGATKQEARVAEKPRGKPMQDELLVSPLPTKGKRREVALACMNRFVGIEEIAKALDCSAGSVRSHLNDLHLKHGLGYEITDGKCRVTAPKGYVEEKDPLA